MKNKVLVFRIIFTVALALVLYYFLLPPINLTSPLFWFYALVVFGFYLFSGIAKIANIKDVITKKTTIKKQTLPLGIGIFAGKVFAFKFT